MRNLGVYHELGHGVDQDIEKAASWCSLAARHGDLGAGTRLVAIGRSNQAIADALGVSAGTIERHVRNLLIKTALHNRTELAHDARERALDT